MCPIRFIRGLLSGEKLALSRSEIVGIVVPKMKVITVEEVLKQALGH